MSQVDFWSEFYKLPAEEVPWQKPQTNWLTRLVDSGKVVGTSALDLGCGPGMKSIYLAKNGFNRVVGVDIVPQAIVYADKNAKTFGVADKTEFVEHDVTDLSFLQDETFDLVVDWSCLHCLKMSARVEYIRSISQHIVSGKTHLVLRAFSNKGTSKRYFVNYMGGKRSRIYLFSMDEIKKLYNPYFKILNTNESKPSVKKEYMFYEILMKAK
jgi:2-polyprenyl-3-methyl-5-hydroxy-6-metoxy-1,4-benzoquinol methylase